MTFVVMGSYQLWQEGPWELPRQVNRPKPLPPSEESKKELPRVEMANTKEIIERNLFDPERGSGRFKEMEADSRSLQKIRSLVLKGTFIIGSERYALLSVPPDGGAPIRDVRVKLGDTVEGFQVAQIDDKKIVLQKGGSNVDLPLDFLRKVEVPAPRRAARSAVPPNRVEPRNPTVPPNASQGENMARERRDQQ